MRSSLLRGSHRPNQRISPQTLQLRSPLVSLTKHLNTPESHLHFPIDFSALHPFPQTDECPAFDRPDVLLSSQLF